MKCLKCGTQNDDTLVHCQSCGNYLNIEQSSDLKELFIAFLFGSILSAIFYLVYPLPMVDSLYVRELFYNPVSEIITTLSLGSVFLIFIRLFQIRKQKKFSLFFKQESFHKIFEAHITPQNTDLILNNLIKNINQLGHHKFQNSLLFKRIRRILLYLKAVPKKEESAKILEYQADIDYNKYQNSYVILDVLIWAIPILGFIGTVYGIGESIGSFSQFIASVDSVKLGTQMRSALGSVTSGLSVAFNTTFLALAFVIPIMVLTSMVKKAHEDFLFSIEEYCLEEILPNIDLKGLNQTADTNILEKLPQLNVLTETWINQMGLSIEGFSKSSHLLTEQLKGLQPVVNDFTKSVFKIKDEVAESDNKELNNGDNLDRVE